MSRTKTTSIYDLAEQTGLSASTISRVLNQRGRISRETRLRVLAAARTAGFRPRASVRQNTVAVVLDRMRFATYGGFQSSMLTSLITCVARYDLAVEVYTEDNVDRLGTRFIDGVLALTWSPSTIAKLRELDNVPVVMINRLDLEDFSTAATDHLQGGRLVAEHLVGRGHERIAFLGEERDWGAKQRIEGVRQALRKRKIDAEALAVGFTEHQPVYSAMKRVLGSGATAIFLAGEDLTIEAMHILSSLFKLRVPEDLSVIGLESAKVSEFTDPPLTTLAQPLEQLAAAAMEVVTQHIQDHDHAPRQHILDNTLIERESVGPPSATPHSLMQAGASPSASTNGRRRAGRSNAGPPAAPTA